MKSVFTIFLIFCFGLMNGQNNSDQINWSFVRFSTKIADKWKFDITPIYRFHQNLKVFQNASVDLYLKHDVSEKITVGLFSRTWFIPEQRPRQFIWFDVTQRFQVKSPIKLSHRLRAHIGLDINDRMDPDVMRYAFMMAYPMMDNKFKPFLTLEPFFQLNGINELQRMRTDVGIQYLANPNINLYLFLRRDDWVIREPTFHDNIWMTGVQYRFPNTWVKAKKLD